MTEKTNPQSPDDIQSQSQASEVADSTSLNAVDSTSADVAQAEASIEEEASDSTAQDAEITTAQGDEGAAEGDAKATQTADKGSAAASAPKEKKAAKRKKKKTADAVTDPAKVPFMTWFEGKTRNHSFSVGEIVAGKITQVDDETLMVDLFGKALAVVDRLQPQDLPASDDADAQAQAAEAESDESPQEAQSDSDTQAAVDVAAVEPSASDESAASAESTQTEADKSALLSESSAAAAAPIKEETKDEASASGQEGQDARADAHHDDAQAQDAAADDASGDAAKAQAQAPAMTLEEAKAVLAEGEQGNLLRDVACLPNTIFRGRVGAIAESGHVTVFNRLVDRKRVRRALDVVRQEESNHVHGIIFGFNRGGFDVVVAGVRAFCPASAFSLKPIANPEEFIGQRLEFTLSPIRSGKYGIVVGRRSMLEREARRVAKERLQVLKPGDVIPGKVSEVREYGLFVNIGGVDGMVHQSELAWKRGVRPGDIAKPGDSLEVKVLEVHPPSRKDRMGRVSLSLRALQESPWETHRDLLVVGSAQQGKVVSTTEFGAFIELAPAVEGLLHISELGRNLKHANEAVKEGDEVRVVVEHVDPKQGRISLSKLSEAMQQAIERGELDMSRRPASLRSGSRVTVRVDSVDPRAVHVQVVGVFGKRGRGVIATRDMGSMSSGNLRKSLKAGTELEVKIVSVERDGTLKCSIKAREADEERQAVQAYRKEAAKQGLGTFGDLLRAKLDNASSSASSNK